MRTKVTWAPIREEFLHGLYAVNGNKLAEVIRVESNRWHCFCYIDGQMVQGEKPDTNRFLAMQQGEEFLSKAVSNG